MANQSPCPLPTYQNPTPNPRVHGRFQRHQEPRAHRQCLKRRSGAATNSQATGLGTSKSRICHRLHEPVVRRSSLPTPRNREDVQSCDCTVHPSSAHASPGYDTVTPKSPASSTRAPCTTASTVRAYRPIASIPASSPRTYRPQPPASSVPLFGRWYAGTSVRFAVLFLSSFRRLDPCSTAVRRHFEGEYKTFLLLSLQSSSSSRLPRPISRPRTHSTQKTLTQNPPPRGFLPGMLSIPDGATSTLFCATSEKAVANSGGYFAPFGKVDKRPDRWNEDEGVVEKLWVESERMVQEAGF